MCDQALSVMPSMLSDRAQAALLDILSNIDAAQAFVLGTSFDSFKDDLKTIYATTRALEIVCEACVRLPADFKDMHPEIAWRDIKDAGNFYRHSYDSVAASFLWKTVHDYLPSLAELARTASKSDAADREPGGSFK